MEAFFTRAADYLASQSWQVAVVFVLVAAACWALRNHSAHWRYLLWLIVLAKCLVPGMISVPLAVLPANDAPQPTPPLVSPVPEAQPFPARDSAPLLANEVKQEVPLERSESIPLPLRYAPSHVAVPSGIHAVDTKSGIELGMRDWLMLAWFAGVMLFLTYLAFRAWTVHRRLILSRQQAGHEMQTTVAALAQRLKLKVCPAIYMADGIAQPFVWGWLRGSIYLPKQFLDTATPEQQQAILTHELAHVARWDAAVNFVQILLQAVFFFHPLIWWTNRQIRREREKCCDEFVLASMVSDPKRYSQAIVGALVAEYEASQPIPSLAIAGRLKNIEERIQTILSPNRRFYRRPSRSALVTAACLIACTVPTAFLLTARAGSSEPKSANASQPTPPSPTKTDAESKAKDKSQNDVVDMKHWQPGQVLDFRVVNAQTKEPLPDVKLLIMFSAKGVDIEKDKVQTTDAQGRSEIRLPDKRPDAVRVYPSKPGFVPLRVYWGDDLPSPKLPKSVTVPMEPGTVWGGIVTNEKGEPIPNATVNVIYLEGADHNPHLRTNIMGQAVTTDKEGRWRMDIFPVKFADEGPRIYLTHPDYASDHLQRGYVFKPITERPSYEDLRSQAAVMVMRKGATIEGQVTDESGKPIPGATICNQEECYEVESYKNSTITNDEGRFQLTGINNFSAPRDTPTGYWDGEKLISVAPDKFKTEAVLTVQAPGFAPELVVATFSANAPLKISLKPGQALQGKVVDEGGRPVEGATISLLFWKENCKRFYLRTKTDPAGKFRINDAPLEDAKYSIEKPDYRTVQSYPMLPTSEKDYLISLTSQTAEKQRKEKTLPANTGASNNPPLAETKAGAEVSAKGGQLFELTVLGPDKKPVPRASVRVGDSFPSWGKLKRGTAVKKGDNPNFYQTDPNGSLLLDFPQKLQRFAIFIEQPGFGPYYANWDAEVHSDPIPSQFVVELEAAWSVGGVIVDSQGKPIEGATINPSIKFKQPPKEFQELHVGTKVATDAEGKWRFGSVPLSMKEVYVEINHPRFKPLVRSLQQSQYGLHAGDQPIAKIELQSGLIVTGKVTDEAGKPIAGAHLRARFWNEDREATTDEHGDYQLLGCEPNKVNLVISAKDKAIDMKAVQIASNMDPVNFVMKPGGKIRARVLDKDGKPVKAFFVFRRLRGEYGFDHLSSFHTDENGVWEWNEAPLDEFQADIGPNGGMQLSNQRLIAREEEYVFRTSPKLTISGRVVDSETQEPIKSFRVVPGFRSHEGTNDRSGKPQIRWASSNTYLARNNYLAKDGQYRIESEEGGIDYVVRVEADGYRVAISRIIKNDEGQVQVDFAMVKAKDVAATVLTPDGKPAAGAEIAVGIVGSEIHLTNGRIWGTGAKYLTDDAGRFHFPTAEGPLQFIIVHSSGFAYLKLPEQEVPSTIHLTAWARMEGTFRAESKPVAHAHIYIISRNLDSSGENTPQISSGHSTMTDNDGHFVFEKIVPGKATIDYPGTSKGDRVNTKQSSQIPAHFSAGTTSRFDLGD